MPEKKCFSSINDHVIAEVCPGRHKGAKFFGAIGFAAFLTGHEHFYGLETTNVQCVDVSEVCFLDLQPTVTVRALQDRGPELNNGWVNEQIGHRDTIEQRGKIIRKTANQIECGIFLSAKS